MSGSVLIVDDMATNRIILKVKLASAYYKVVQAASIEEACICLSDHAPDLVLLGGRVIEADGRAALDRLRHAAGEIPPAIAVILDSTAPAARIAALNAGADDVISRPIPDRVFMARLRSLLRQRHADHDLMTQARTTGSAGFAEAQHGFSAPGQIAIIGGNPIAGRKLQSVLDRGTHHGVHRLDAEQIMTANRKLHSDDTLPAPDLFLLVIDPETPDEGLHILANLVAAPGRRDGPVIAHLPCDKPDLAATLLDMGASDVVFCDADPSELTLRLAAHLDRKRRHDQLRRHLHDSLEASVIDPLTGLYNRRYAMSYLDRLLAGGASTPGQSHAVMLADLDHFKQVNDTFGHMAGDRVLAHVAKTLSRQLRPGDLIARIGGEEFLIVLPDATRASARNAAQEMCRAIRGSPAPVPGQSDPVEVTISIGLTLADPTNATRAEAAIDLADRALYCSKAEGRNMVTFSGRDAA